MHNLVGDDHFAVVRQFKQFFSRYQRSRDLIAVGAYQAGGDPVLDTAVRLYPRLEAFLQQGIHERESHEGALRKLAEVFG
jgi:flagellum-specific ATP synthase